MTNVKVTERLKVVDVIERYGRCVELVSMDPHFHDITVGLYFKGDIGTVWTFSRKPGVEERIRQIRDRLFHLGGLEPVEGTHDQARTPCGVVHRRPTKFLVRQAVEKDPNTPVPEGKFTIKDLRSPLMLGFESSEVDGRWVYRATAEGEAPNVDARLRAITAGLIRYGELEKVDDDGVSCPCGYRHDGLARLAMPLARNVGAVEDMLAADALRGQMTTGTLGFTPPT